MRSRGPMLLEEELPPTAPQPRVRAGNRLVVAQCLPERRGIHQEPGHRDLQGKAADHRLVPGVDHEAVSCALMLQDRHGFPHHVVFALLHVKSQNRAQLFPRNRGAWGLSPAPGPPGRWSTPGPKSLPAPQFSWHSVPPPWGSGGHRDGREWRPPCLPLPWRGSRPLLQGLLADLLGNGPLHNDALLRGTNGAVVKGLGADDICHGFGDVCRLVDIGRAVACADANGRFAGGVGRPDHTRAAGGQNQTHRRALHQFVYSLHGGSLQATHCAPGAAGPSAARATISTARWVHLAAAGWGKIQWSSQPSGRSWPYNTRLRWDWWREQWRQ